MIPRETTSIHQYRSDAHDISSYSISHENAERKVEGGEGGHTFLPSSNRPLGVSSMISGADIG